MQTLFDMLERFWQTRKPLQKQSKRQREKRLARWLKNQEYRTLYLTPFGTLKPYRPKYQYDWQPVLPRRRQTIKEKIERYHRWRRNHYDPDPPNYEPIFLSRHQ